MDKTEAKAATRAASDDKDQDANDLDADADIDVDAEKSSSKSSKAAVEAEAEDSADRTITLSADAEDGVVVQEDSSAVRADAVAEMVPITDDTAADSVSTSTLFSAPTPYVEPLLTPDVVPLAATMRLGTTELQTVTFALAATAIDPAREAYLRQFRQADPNNLYYTPASPDWVIPSPPSWTEDQYRQFVLNQMGSYGTAGFSLTASGQLQYRNPYNQTVAVQYAPRAAGYYEPAGIRIVAPGQTVVLPYPSGAAAQAQLPRGGSTERQAAVAAIGYGSFVRGAVPNPPRPIPVPVASSGGSSSPKSKPTNPAPKPVVKRDLGGDVNKAIIQAGWLLDALYDLNGQDWAKSVAKDYPIVGTAFKKILPLVNTALALLDGTSKATGQKNPVTGSLDLASGFAGSAAIAIPFFLPHLVPLKAAFAAASASLALLSIAIHAVNPDL